MSINHLSSHMSNLAPGASHLQSLVAIRQYELRRALSYFKSPDCDGRKLKVLEIGAGTGQQAQELQNAGYDVTAIDLESSCYRSVRVFDVIDYDGATIPASDGTFDVVFSSNVLEHVAAIDDFLEETKRVMAKEGIAIHILPSGTCKLWSIAAHYLWLSKRICALFRKRKLSASESSCKGPRRPITAKEWLGTIAPLRHGERGNTVTEIFYFSRRWWKRKFREHGFKIVRADPNGLFYTMANSMTETITLNARSKLSKVLGSSCTIFLLTRSPH